MKSATKGLIVLLAVIAVAVGYTFLMKSQPDKIHLNGYLGGEKIGLLEDTEIQDVLKKNYGITFTYQKAGSLDMVKADHSGKNYLFPSSQTALDLYEKTVGKPMRSQIVFNTPIVLYSRKLVVDALIDNGMVSVTDGVHFINMPQLVSAIESGKTWAELGISQLYGNLAVNTTDPRKSNSGNMFAGLIANIINNGQVVDRSSVDQVTPKVRHIFQRLGYVETSFADLFDQYLKTGVGAKPLVAGYESQLLEFAVQNPADWERLMSDVVLLYPTPTAWSSHIYIALDEGGSKGIDGLLDKKIQELAWTKHGFRTGVSGGATDVSIFGIEGIAKDVTNIIPMPGADIMEMITDNIQ